MATLCHECRALSGGSVRNRRTSRQKLSNSIIFFSEEQRSLSLNLVEVNRIVSTFCLFRVPHFMSGKCN